MKGFDIDGTDLNMNELVEKAKDYDAVVVCLGEHVYSERKIHDIKTKLDTK